MKRLELEITLKLLKKMEKLPQVKEVPEAAEASEEEEAEEEAEASEVASVAASAVATEAEEEVPRANSYPEIKMAKVTDLPEEDMMMTGSTDLPEEPSKRDINPEEEVAIEATMAQDKTSKVIDNLEKETSEVHPEAAVEPEEAPENPPEAEASEILS